MIVHRKALMDALTVINRVIDKRKRAPAGAGNVTLTARAGTLTLTAGITTTLSLTLPCSNGDLAIVLPYATLKQLVRSRRRGGDSVLHCTPVADGVRIQGDGIAAELRGLPLNDPPQEERPGAWQCVASWRADSLARALAYVLPAMSADVTRRHINGVLCDRAALVATDGHRLHWAALPVWGIHPHPVLLPAAVAQLLLALLSDLDYPCCERFGDRLRVQGDTWIIEAPWAPVDDFPPYQKLIADCVGPTPPLRIDGRALAAALRDLPTTPRGGTVEMVLTDTITLRTVDAVCTATVRLPLEQGDRAEEPLTVRFDPAYLWQAIGQDAGELLLYVMDAIEPLSLVEGEKRLAIVMPKRP